MTQSAREDEVPAADEQESAADRRGDDRDDDEHHHHEGHHLCHAAAAVDVADHRDGDDARGGVGEALQAAGGEESLEAAGDDAEERGDGVDGEADDQHRLAPEDVGERPLEELADGEADDVARHHELLAVGVGDTEVCAHVGQRRQHDVDRQSGQRHQQRHHRDELRELRHGARAHGGGDLGHDFEELWTAP